MERKRRFWSFNDQALILETLAAARRRHHGQQPIQLSVLVHDLRPGLERKNVKDSDLFTKIHNLREKYRRVVAFHVQLNTHRDRELHRLSADVWGDDNHGDAADVFDP